MKKLNARVKIDKNRPENGHSFQLRKLDYCKVLVNFIQFITAHRNSGSLAPCWATIVCTKVQLATHAVSIVSAMRWSIIESDVVNINLQN